jgi:hypothetical protein
MASKDQQRVGRLHVLQQVQALGAAVDQLTCGGKVHSAAAAPRCSARQSLRRPTAGCRCPARSRGWQAGCHPGGDRRLSDGMVLMAGRTPEKLSGRKKRKQVGARRRVFQAWKLSQAACSVSQNAASVPNWRRSGWRCRATWRAGHAPARAGAGATGPATGRLALARRQGRQAGSAPAAAPGAWACALARPGGPPQAPGCGTGSAGPLKALRGMAHVFEGAVARDHGADDALAAHDVFADGGIDVQMANSTMAHMPMWCQVCTSCDWPNSGITQPNSLLCPGACLRAFAVQRKAGEHHEHGGEHHEAEKHGKPCQRVVPT